MFHRSCNPDSRRAFGERRRGFTLVELMVSVALSIIVLGLFATIYHYATETYTKQKGIRRNDQRSRMLTIVLRGDFKARTFRDIMPFWPNQNTRRDFRRFQKALRRGYFCISENDPNNHTDDVVSFTIQIPADHTQRYYLGRSTLLKRPNDRTPNAQYLTNNRNQPEHDDGVMRSVGGRAQAVINDSSISRAAEVCYFLRNGNLYRRMLLIRDPYDGRNAQPNELRGLFTTSLVPRVADPNPISFWRYFSFSAYYKHNGANRGPKFHSFSTSLQNEGPNPSANVDPDFLLPRSLGIPHLRFGHSLTRGLLPREYVSRMRDASGAVVTGKFFIGRFLAQETGDPEFGYPGHTTSGDPHTRADLLLNQHPLAVNGQGQSIPVGVLDQYANSIVNRGEDILMTNVHEFDVKVWDDRVGPLGRFVDLGHNINPNGYYHRNKNNRNRGFLDGNWDWNRFDTWHPFRMPDPTDPTNNSKATTLGQPPYRATYRAPNAPPRPSTALGSPHERPLRAIQIRIRFYDVSTNQMRQVTLVEHLQPRQTQR